MHCKYRSNMMRRNSLCDFLTNIFTMRRMERTYLIDRRVIRVQKNAVTGKIPPPGAVYRNKTKR